MSPNPARLCGSLLIAGLLVFFVGAVFWRLSFQAPALGDSLRSVGEERGRWLWIHVWLAAGVLLTVGGLITWTEIQWEAGERLLTPVGVSMFVIGAVLWLLAMGIRVTIEDWAAGEVLSGNGVPAIYPSIHRLAGLLYAAHMVLSYVSAFVLGTGVLSSHVLSSRLGWVGVIGGAVSTVGFVLARGGPFAPPFLAHLYSCALGIMLLRSA